MRFIRSFEGGLWITDSRKEESPYKTAFIHKSHLVDIVDLNHLPNRDIIFEFDLFEDDKGIQATNVKLIHSER